MTLADFPSYNVVYNHVVFDSLTGIGLLLCSRSLFFFLCLLDYFFGVLDVYYVYLLESWLVECVDICNAKAAIFAIDTSINILECFKELQHHTIWDLFFTTERKDHLRLDLETDESIGEYFPADDEVRESNMKTDLEKFTINPRAVNDTWSYLLWYLTKILECR